jgi:hypothetical protein
MKKYCITFAGGSRHNYMPAALRLMKQARNINLFNECLMYSDKYLQSDNEFWSKHGEFIKKNQRGYGYWLWKPYIIKKTFEKAMDGDIILYVDAGCELLYRKRNLFLHYFQFVQNDLIIGSLSITGGKSHYENQYNKMDLIMNLEMNDEKYLSTHQRQAGAILFYVNEKTRDLVNKWYDIASNNYHFIDDSPSINKNLNSFIEHRHDQSIFSLLTKKYDIFSKHNIMNIVEYIRNRTGYCFAR